MRFIVSRQEFQLGASGPAEMHRRKSVLLLVQPGPARRHVKQDAGLLRKNALAAHAHAQSDW